MTGEDASNLSEIGLFEELALLNFLLQCQFFSHFFGLIFANKILSPLKSAKGLLNLCKNTNLTSRAKLNFEKILKS